MSDLNDWEKMRLTPPPEAQQPRNQKAIPPALTPDEWRLLDLWLCGKMPGGKVRGIVVLDLPYAHHHPAMAVANACLPDGDPRKITREDVKIAEQAAGVLEDEWGLQEGPAHNLAAKLAALLPPA